MKRTKLNNNKITALYCRLSKDDGTNNESMSIGTKKTMLKEYAKRNSFLNCQFYVDDGYSGTNYDRPAFQQLIEDIRNGEILTLITKDLSRLEKNYFETGTYIEVFFSNRNVCYIVVNDGVDSIDNTQMDITLFRNIINGMYAKDASRKIKSALRTRKLQRKHMAITPSFGYRKDESGHNHFVIDEVTESIVELIFSIAKEGVGLHTICNRLRKAKVIKPSFYKKEMFERYIDEEKMYDWDTAYVSKILHDPVYAGNLIVAERPTKTMRSKKRQYIPFAEREVIYGTHYMEYTKIQWHPGFVAAMGMEFKEDRENLEFESEHNLNMKPLEIDLLVIKKEPYTEIHNEIGKIFRRYNIMEYKSPEDSLSIDTFYKVTAYACLYKSYGKTVDSINADDITISLVRDTKPKKLFSYFKDKKAGVTIPYKGIYYINGVSMFPAQIIVTSELEQKGHVWVKALTDKMEKNNMENLIEKSCRISDEYDRKLVESILEVTLNANSNLIEELIGDVKMGEMILKVVQPLIVELEKKAKIEGIEEGKKSGIEEGKILGAVEILRNFNNNNEIKTIIMEKYHLTESDAEKYLKA